MSSGFGKGGSTINRLALVHYVVQSLPAAHSLPPTLRCAVFVSLVGRIHCAAF